MILLLTRDDFVVIYFFHYAPGPLLQVVVGLWFKFWVSKQLGVHRVFGALGFCVLIFRSFFLVYKIMGASGLSSILHRAKNIPAKHQKLRTLVNEIGFRIDVQFRRASVGVSNWGAGGFPGELLASLWSFFSMGFYQSVLI